MGRGRKATHGRSKNDPTYRSWVAMLKRCCNPNYEKYPYYGGRGIAVCDRWRFSFENFLADNGERPPNTTIDRWPNNDGMYELGNTRWATKKEQASNRRSSKVTLEVAQEILGRLEHGESRESIAARLALSKSRVIAICNGSAWPELERPIQSAPVTRKRRSMARGESAARHAKEHGISIVEAAKLFDLACTGVRHHWRKLYGEVPTPDRLAKNQLVEKVAVLAKEGLCPTDIANKLGLSVRRVCDIRDRHGLAVPDGRNLLTLARAQEILGRFEHGEARKSIAVRLRLSKSLVTSVINGSRWPELDRPWLNGTSS